MTTQAATRAELLARARALVPLLKGRAAAAERLRHVPGETIGAIAAYGFIASVLPVWLLLCPRDYLSSFLKIGTIALLVVGVIVANPTLAAPAINHHFQSGGGYR